MKIFDKFMNSEDVSSKNKRSLIIILSVMGFLLVLYVMVSMGGKEPVKRKSRNDTVKEIFTSADAKKLGIGGMAAEIKDINKEMAAIKQDNIRLKRQLEESEEKSKAIQELREQQVSQQAVVQALAEFEKIYGKRIKDIDVAIKTGSAGKASERAQSNTAGSPQPRGNGNSAYGGPIDPEGTASSDFNTQKEKNVEVKLKQSQVNWGEAPDPLAETTASTGQSQQGGQGTPAKGRKQKEPEFRTIVEDDPPEEESALEEEYEDIFIPATTIISGVLITGMDVPTSDSTRSNPYPSFLRIKKEAILPNRFRADIRECGMLVTGYGELSSHRAILRGESISCIREDGGVIEVSMDAYASGEDGKLGVRGRLVDKRGQLIAKSLMAGFMNGVASVFNQVPVPTISTTASDTTAFQAVASSEAMQSAAVQGTGEALERVADYYLEMADNIFPVLEVDAGREVQFIVTNGFSMKAKGR